MGKIPKKRDSTPFRSLTFVTKKSKVLYEPISLKKLVVFECPQLYRYPNLGVLGNSRGLILAAQWLPGLLGLHTVGKVPCVQLESSGTWWLHGDYVANFPFLGRLAIVYIQITPPLQVVRISSWIWYIFRLSPTHVQSSSHANLGKAQNVFLGSFDVQKKIELTSNGRRDMKGW